jgi:methylglutaconyl-CoA hydratase
MVEIRSGVAHVSLNRPEVHHAFDDEMMRALASAFARISQNDAVRLAVIRSEGKTFCAGADIRWMKRMVGYSFEENVADATLLHTMLRAIRDCPKPVIARVQGAAFGGAVGLVAACDIAVASQAASFCISEVKLGIIPAVISPFLLEAIGIRAARRYALTAERFDAAQALRIGLVHEVVESTEALDPWISRLSEQIGRNGPLALAACKRVLHEVGPLRWEQAREITARAISEIRVSPEGQDGLNAFLDKRPPGWQG